MLTHILTHSHSCQWQLPFSDHATPMCVISLYSTMWDAEMSILAICNACSSTLFPTRCLGDWETCFTWWTCRSLPPPCRPPLRRQEIGRQRSALLSTATVWRWWGVLVRGTQRSWNLQSNSLNQRTYLPLLPTVRLSEQHGGHVVTWTYEVFQPQDQFKAAICLPHTSCSVF